MKDKNNYEDYDYLAHAASTTDCTGLIPTLVQTEDEREAYEAIYPYTPSKISLKKKGE